MSDMVIEKETGSEVGTGIEVGNEYANEKEKEPPVMKGSTTVVPVTTNGMGMHVLGLKADKAAALAAKFAGHTLDPIEAKRVRRKIDWHVLPLMMFLYLLQFLDKTTLGYSAVLGLKEDTNMDVS